MQHTSFSYKALMRTVSVSESMSPTLNSVLAPFQLVCLNRSEKCCDQTASSSRLALMFAPSAANACQCPYQLHSVSKSLQTPFSHDTPE